MFLASLIALNVFFGFANILFGSRFIACLNFSVVAFVMSAELMK